MSLTARLERYFDFAAPGTDWKTGILAGFTTFTTMAYVPARFWQASVC
jgi:adenine/guanine/hypoxanthine permease